MLHFTRYYKDTKEINDFDVILIQIYQGICVPIIIEIKKDLTKLLQK